MLRARKEILLLVLICLLVIARSVFFENIATRPLNDFDEARYAEIAKNISRVDELLVPLAGGPDEPRDIVFAKLASGSELYPYFWKPPLHTWIIALSQKIFGINELAVRIPSLTFSLGVLSVSYLIAKKTSRSAIVGIFSAMVIISASDFSFLASQGIAEMQMLFFCLMTVYLMTENSKTSYLLSGISLGMAIMTKSFAVFWVIPAGIVLYYAIQGKWPSLKNLGIMILSSLLISLPWHVYMYFSFGSAFVDGYVLANTVGRATGSQQNIAPIYWYAKYISFFWLPWSLTGLVSSIVSYSKIPESRKRILLLIVWLILIFVPYSLMKSKVWWYVFPTIVPLAVIVAYPMKYAHGKYRKILTIFFITVSAVTFLYSCHRANMRDFGTTSVRNLARRNPGIPSLAVSGRPYESVLYYFDTGNISSAPSDKKYLITTIDQKNTFIVKGYTQIDREADLVLLKK